MEYDFPRIFCFFFDPNHRSYVVDLPFLSKEMNSNDYSASSSSISGVSSEGNHSDESSFSDPAIELINQMLMEEEDLESKTCMFQESLALEATEKSFYDALGERYPFSLNQSFRKPNNDDFPTNCSGNANNDDFPTNFRGESHTSLIAVNNFLDQSYWVPDQEKYQHDSFAKYSYESILQSIAPSKGLFGDWLVDSFQNNWKGEAKAEMKSANGSREQKSIHNREGGGDFENSGRSSKQLAASAEEFDEQVEMYDKDVISLKLTPQLRQELEQEGPEKGGRKGRSKKNEKTKVVVDLRTLLSQCAQAVSSADIISAKELLNWIRQHSSPYGDGMERLAHYFANALEARLAGNAKSTFYIALTAKSLSAKDVMRSYKGFIKGSPFKRMSNFFSSRTICKLTQNSQRFHIIHFGILYGFQWPCLIQHLSVRPGGPPNVRMTGIDLPGPGFRPAEGLESTGRRLATYCNRFGVPFEFNAIAKKWDTINIEDLKIERDEVLIVNCLHRMKNIPDDIGGAIISRTKNAPDDIGGAISPRDAVLNMIKRINPDLFIHEIQNGTYDTPYFVSRFREALLYYYARFDMCETTMNREDEDRFVCEKEVLGREIMNVVACEGSERTERPETYKQWQFRNRRIGFAQVPLDMEILSEVKDMVKLQYNKNFGVDEDDNWMLQLWKGRIIYAITCWKCNEE